MRKMVFNAIPHLTIYICILKSDINIYVFDLVLKNKIKKYSSSVSIICVRIRRTYVEIIVGPTYCIQSIQHSFYLLIQNISRKYLFTLFNWLN